MSPASSGEYLIELHRRRVPISRLVETLDIMAAHSAGIWMSCLNRRDFGR